VPRSITFRREGAHVDFSGIVTVDDFLGVNDFILGQEDPAGKPRYALFDFSAAERIDLSADDIKAIAAEDERDQERIGDMLIPIVAPQAIIYGLARMWEGLVDAAEFDSRVVRTRAEAILWLAGRGIVVRDD
jgi:hypothetical protein